MLGVRSALLLVALLSASSCYSGAFYTAELGGDTDALAGDSSGAPGVPSDDPGATMGAGDTGGESDAVDTGGDEGDGNAPAAEGRGLPCEVEALLVARCISCHGSTPAGGAPNSLVEHADLVAESLTQPGRTVAEVSVERMRAEGPVMPPGAGPSIEPDELDPFAAWVDAGMPAEDCGAEGDADVPADNPFDVEPTCTSDDFWGGGLFGGSSQMNPGRACISCHSDPEAFGSGDDDEGPAYWFAGTIYATAHEPDDCNGVDGSALGVRIEVTSANGETRVVEPNRVGNFGLGRGAVANFDPPYTVRVITADGVRAMAGPAPSGDCNACHTQFGASGAPGRVILP